MASPSVELQDAVLTRLKADMAVDAHVGDRIYDMPPEGAGFPYLSFGPSDLTPDDDAVGCMVVSSHSLQIDVWDRSQGRLWKAKEIVAAVKKSLHRFEATLPTHRLVSMQVERAATILDADGITAHGIVSVIAVIEEV